MYIRRVLNPLSRQSTLVRRRNQVFSNKHTLTARPLKGWLKKKSNQIASNEYLTVLQLLCSEHLLSQSTQFVAEKTATLLSFRQNKRLQGVAIKNVSLQSRQDIQPNSSFRRSTSFNEKIPSLRRFIVDFIFRRSTQKSVDR